MGCLPLPKHFFLKQTHHSYSLFLLLYNLTTYTYLLFALWPASLIMPPKRTYTSNFALRSRTIVREQSGATGVARTPSPNPSRASRCSSSLSSARSVTPPPGFGEVERAGPVVSPVPSGIRLRLRLPSFPGERVSPLPVTPARVVSYGECSTVSIT